MMAADTLCRNPFGEFRLRRHPTRRDEPLQAWCAADLLILDELHRLGSTAGNTLVINDEHGALAVALQAQALWTDSALAGLALQHNLAANQQPAIPLVWSTDTPPASPLVALRIPKQLSYLEYQLGILAAILEPGAKVIAAGMDKHLSPQVATLLERYIGPTRRHRGERKARLFSASRADTAGASAADISSYYCDTLGDELQALPNVFSRDRIDGGSRLLLAQLPRLAPASAVMDLACGNGVLGLAAFRLGLARRVIMADESAMAIASARLNAGRLFAAESAAFSFHHGDGLASYPGPAAELILCNPPFHLNHAVDEYAGRRLLQQSASKLPPGGRLCLVANRHLDYLATLKRDFAHVETLTGDRRFTVWLARRD